jgi:hypothetical protein
MNRQSSLTLYKMLSNEDSSDRARTLGDSYSVLLCGWQAVG